MITSAEFSIMYHAVGSPKHKDATMYRNRYVVEDGHEGCERLVSIGLMRKHSVAVLPKCLVTYVVTDAGKDAVRDRLVMWRRYAITIRDDDDTHHEWAASRGRARANVIRSILESGYVDRWIDAARMVSARLDEGGK